MPPKTSGKAAKKAGKAQKNISKNDKKKKRRRKESYAIYIYKVLKQRKPPASLTTTRGRRSPVGRSRLPSGCCCPESWPSTLSPKVPRPSPSTPARSKSDWKLRVSIKSALFRATTF
ncbi:UNVERIFIED_CONTAM: hypothetical protein PYX00_010481 [Menopon gallinae]|uniref:Histone H2B n=1 Tax=Menopon gallinae TaxID=328185 RepID=A0AAW2HFK1_9NEOP